MKCVLTDYIPYVQNTGGKEHTSHYCKRSLNAPVRQSSKVKEIDGFSIIQNITGDFTV